MTAMTSRILDRLREVGFSVREGGITPFGEELPLVTGVAWDRTTAQVALVAEATDRADTDAWAQLLFAASGLRHHLGTDQPAGFRSPLVLAMVDDRGERCLRELVEELTTRYALFNRVDLNLVRHADLATDDALDTALAPLLPACRRALGQTISHEDVRRFWEVLRERVREAARDLDVVFGDLRHEIADEVADHLIGAGTEVGELVAPTPAREVELENFRSFASARIPFQHVTVLHGLNGSGKSSVLEALELVWAGTSLRRPPGVSAAEYQRHLPRGGDGPWKVRGWTSEPGEERVISEVSDRPRAELRRSVLTQEAVAALVASPPDERYGNLLAVTGLEIPELDATTRSLVIEAKAEADAALREAGVAPLSRTDSRGLDHLRQALAGGFTARLPAVEELAAAEGGLAVASNGFYEPREWRDQRNADAALTRLDAELQTLAADPRGSADVGDELPAAAAILRELSEPRRSAARALRLLVDAIASSLSSLDAQPPPRAEAVIPPALAVRWLNHADAAADAAGGFRADAANIQDSEWRERLDAYADALDRASEVTPRNELARLARAVSKQPVEPRVLVDGERWVAAGFSGPPERGQELLPFLNELAAHLARHADAYDALASELERHPARAFGARADRVLRTLCRFELARHVRRQGPIMRASEDLLRDLLQGRLYPVVRELVAAMVRFEWYFQPLRITVEGRQVLMGGLATPNADLDARLLLNSAERTVVGLAWFLALHLLQPEERRRVLVLDDPAASFDAVNRAGFAATLRAFVRLARPEQVVVATHDDSAAALFAEELAPVDHWPNAVAVVRCRRDASDASVATVDETRTTSRDLREDEIMLGIGGEPTLFSA